MIFVTDKIQIPEKELHFQFVRSSGPGGQNVNKVNSKAQLKWNVAASALAPEVKDRFLAQFGGRVSSAGDVQVQSDRYRDRLRNQEDCLEKLREMILSVAFPPKKRKKTRPTFSSQQKRLGSKKKNSQKKQGRSGGSWE